MTREQIRPLTYCHTFFGFTVKCVGCEGDVDLHFSLLLSTLYLILCHTILVYSIPIYYIHILGALEVVEVAIFFRATRVVFIVLGQEKIVKATIIYETFYI